jgi:DNA-binding transcriptional MerR regulator
MVEEPSLTPRAAAARLGLPASTLRAYATEFQPLLSAGAKGPSASQDRTFRHRRYSDADLVVLRRAQALLESGLSYPAAREQLGHVSRDVAGARRLTSNQSVGRTRPASNPAKAGEAGSPAPGDSGASRGLEAARAQELVVLEELASRLQSIESTLAEHGKQLLEIGAHLTSRSEKSVQQEPAPREPLQQDFIEALRKQRRGLLGWLARWLS